MIIAAYTGCGKSFWANSISDSIDLVSMPYRWILPDAEEGIELEQEKGALYHVANPFWPTNYIFAILEAEDMYKYVIIPSIEIIVAILSEEYNRRICLVYPKRELKEEYKHRYEKRRNRESFMELFYDCWEERIACLESMRVPKIELKTGEYLTDVRDQIDFIAESADCLKSCKDAGTLDALKEVKEQMERKRESFVLVVPDVVNNYLLEITEIESNETRRFIYEMASNRNKIHMGIPYIIRKEEKECYGEGIVLHSKEELLQTIERTNY